MHFQRVFAQAFGLETTIAEVVFGLVCAGIVAAVLLSWYRHRRRRPASRKDEANHLELGYVLSLTGMAVFLVTLSFSTNASFWRAPPAAMPVRVTAYQWCWDFQYPRQSVSVTATCAGGKLPTLVVPAGRPVRLDLTSRDVLHSFWVPALRVKMDAYPQHVNSFTMTLRDGRWVGRCAQFCGLYHFGMDFYLQAVPPAEFSRWVRAHGGHAGGGA